jgi:hypothetical protein
MALGVPFLIADTCSLTEKGWASDSRLRSNCWFSLQREEDVHDAHAKTAEQHELAARAHRTAAEHNEKGENQLEDWHLQRALEYSGHAYKLAREAHSKSGQIGPLQPVSPRNNNEALYDNPHSAADLHDRAAHAHRVAHEEGDGMTGDEHSRRALEASQAADELTRAAAFGRGVVTFGHDEIATLAHELWQARGCPYGSPEEDWLRAEGELRARNR